MILYHIYIHERRSRKPWNMIELGHQENLGGPLVGRVLIVAVAKRYSLCVTESHRYTWVD